MNKSTSILLDLFRFLAALLVSFHHSEHALQSAWLKPLASFGHDSVVFFFLLSGFVIAHTTQEKDRNLRDYAVARLARLWSVALPSLLLVVALYYSGSILELAGYASIGGDQWLKILVANAFFVGQSVEPRIAVPTNAAYWSVCYEMWYYIIFGLAFFLRGYWRLVLTVVAAFVAGLPILLMFPIWCVGFWFYRLHRYWSPGVGVSVLTFFGALLVYFVGRAHNLDDRLYDMYAEMFGGDALLNKRLGFAKHFLVDYVTATIVLLLAVSSISLANHFQSYLFRFQRLIALAASTTFSLYLYHMPLLSFLSPIIQSDAVVMGLTLSSIGVLAVLTERHKAPYIKLFRALLPRVHTQPSNGD